LTHYKLSLQLISDELTPHVFFFPLAMPQQRPQQQPTAYTPPTNNPAARSSIFTETQLAALKYQILAFKLISKNLPLPPYLQQAVLASPSTENLTASRDGPASANAKGQDVSQPQTPAKLLPETPPTATAVQSAIGTEPATAEVVPPPQPPTPSQFNAYVSPYSLLKAPISSYAHASRQQRLLIPALTPIGMDSDELIIERERRVKARVHYRIQELESLPNNLSNDLPDKITALESDIKDAGKNGSSVKLRAIIELKALRLLEKQKKVSMGRLRVAILLNSY
jgi:ATP-dependent helicase STH1/SNF2